MPEYIRVYNLPEHYQIKHQILNLIDRYKYEVDLKPGVSGVYNDARVHGKVAIDYIKKNRFGKYDFNTIIDKYVQPYIDEFLDQFGTVEVRDEADINDRWWFHDYPRGVGFQWHIHPSHFSVVYYLNLPDNKEKTHFYDQSFEVNEGDMIIFPGFLPHTSPVSNSGKIIIARNINTNIDPKLLN